MEVGDRVEELDRLAGGPGDGDRLPQRVGHQAVGVHLGVHHLALEGLEDAERPDVRRRLADDDVARVAEDPGDQVDGLLRADGDDDVVRVGGDALEGHHLADLLAQGRVALAGGVLQGDRAMVRDQLGDGAADDVERQAGDVGHPAGERDHLGARGDGEQGPDLRGRHALGTRGVAVDVAVETRAAEFDRRVVHGASSMNDRDGWVQRARCDRSRWIRRSRRWDARSCGSPSTTSRS